jgi:GDP-L-fucose synthase
VSSFWEDARVLVTGGTGFVGTHLVLELLARGARVRVPVHRRPPIVHDARVELVPGDLTNLDDCRALARGMQYVLHAGGAVSTAGTTPGAAMSAITLNTVVTVNTLQACWDEGVERALVFSSSTAYPPADHPVVEDELWSGDPYPGYFGYGWMRRYTERLCEFAASKSSLGIALVRPTAIYGRFDDFDPAHSHVIPALIRRAVAREDPFVVWGTGDEVRDVLHVRDLARGCLLLLEHHAVCDPVNIGSGEAVTVRQLVETILRAAGHGRARVVYDASKPATIPVRMVDVAKARRLLGFAPQVALEDGLVDTVRWWRDGGFAASA